jgi:hypothetical protein
MTTYKALKGKKIKFLASDPPATVGEGQMWYNGTDYKTAIFTEAWASGGNLPAATGENGGSGTQTAALSWGGNLGSPGYTNASNSYDGSSWTSAPTLSTARRSIGSGWGTSTSAGTAGGILDNTSLTNNTEEYDGSSWSETANYPSVIAAVRCVGATQNAGLGIGGNNSTAGVKTCNEYDGSSWTAGGTLNRPSGAGEAMHGFGTQTAAIGAGGYPHQNDTRGKQSEEYDGSSWTATNPLIEESYGGGSFGTVNAGGTAGGIGNTTGFQRFDGTSYTAGPSMGAAAYVMGSGNNSTQTAGIVFGGNPKQAGTEEFTAEFLVKTLTDS